MVASLALAAALVVAQLPDSTADQRAFRAILNDFNTAWNTKDPALFVKNFANDADFMQAFGRYFPSRAATQEFMGFFFSKQTGDFRTREVGVRTKWISESVVFLEQELEGFGVRNADGTEQPARRGQMMLIVEKKPEGWRIRSYRYLDIHGGPIYKTPPK